MTTFINLTPHTINVAIGDNIIALPADGREARVSSENVLVGTIEYERVLHSQDVFDERASIPIVKTVYGDVETVRKNADGSQTVLHVGLPEPQVGTVYIVSMLVGGLVHGRDDLYGPDSGPTAIREQGQIKAVRNLIKYQ